MLDRLCAEIGRQPADLRRLLVVGNPVETRLRDAAAVWHLIDTYAELGFTDIVLPYPLDGDERALDVLGSVLFELRQRAVPEASPPVGTA
jgi:hypothetical protein